MRVLTRVEGPALALGGAGAAAIVAFVLVEMGPVAAIALCLLPLLAVAFVWVITSGQYVLFAAAIALPMVSYPGFGEPLVGTLYYQDLFAGLSLAALIFAKVLGRGRVPPIPRTPVLGLPFLLFAAAIVSATLRGHYAFGAALFGQPLRLILYAAVVVGLAGMTVPKMYMLLHVLFYPGAVYAALLGLFFLATGGSSTDQDILSTGGSRLLSITTSLHCAGALFLAALNLRFGLLPRWRLLHLLIAAFGLFGVIIGFGRASYAAVGVVGALFLVTSPRLRGAIWSYLPLALPFLAVLAVAFTQAAPDFVGSISSRMFSAPESDSNVEWRVLANQAVLPQFEENPLFGVGFGRGSEFFLELESPSTGQPVFQRVEIGQDPHNGYLFLLAGGGLAALGSFVLLLGTFAGDAVRRYRRNSDPRARLLVLWASGLLFVFLFNAASGTTFSVPENILTIWALLVLPAVVGPGSEEGSSNADVDTGVGDDRGREPRLREVARPAW